MSITDQEIYEMIDCLRSHGFSEETIDGFRNSSTTTKKETSENVSNKKTIEQWLKGYLTEKEFENAKFFKFSDWNIKVNCLSQAIINGFWWNYMPEGRDYWNNKYNDLVEKGL